MIKCTFLGQSGFRIEYKNTVLFIDPYLTNCVAEQQGDKYNRLVPPILDCNFIHDANYILITHAHNDHCDISTLKSILNNSTNCKIIAPIEVCKYLKNNNFLNDRLLSIKDQWIQISDDIEIRPVPAAHPNILKKKIEFLPSVGYLIRFSSGKKIYHAGDTFLFDELIDFISKFKSIDIALLPINEHNYFKSKMDIIGNMTMRESFEFASLLEVEYLVPIHWDLFENNSVFKEEIELFYKLTKPSFNLCLNPTFF